jgi:hypothetical protein
MGDRRALRAIRPAPASSAFSIGTKKIQILDLFFHDARPPHAWPPDAAARKFSCARPHGSHGIVGRHRVEHRLAGQFGGVFRFCGLQIRNSEPVPDSAFNDTDISRNRSIALSCRLPGSDLRHGSLIGTTTPSAAIRASHEADLILNAWTASFVTQDPIKPRPLPQAAASRALISASSASC